MRSQPQSRTLRTVAAWFVVVTTSPFHYSCGSCAAACKTPNIVFDGDVVLSTQASELDFQFCYDEVCADGRISDTSAAGACESVSLSTTLTAAICLRRVDGGTDTPLIPSVSGRGPDFRDGATFSIDIADADTGESLYFKETQVRFDKSSVCGRTCKSAVVPVVG